MEINQMNRIEKLIKQSNSHRIEIVVPFKRFVSSQLNKLKIGVFHCPFRDQIHFFCHIDFNHFGILQSGLPYTQHE